MPAALAPATSVEISSPTTSTCSGAHCRLARALSKKARDGLPVTVAWVRAADLSSYPMPPADLPLIPILRDWL